MISSPQQSYIQMKNISCILPVEELRQTPPMFYLQCWLFSICFVFLSNTITQSNCTVKNHVAHFINILSDDPPLKNFAVLSPHQAVSVENVKDFGHCRFYWKAQLRKWLAIRFACMELCQEQRETLLRELEREYKEAVITYQAVENWDSYQAG